MNKTIIGWVAVCAVACGGGSSVTGTVDGLGVSVKDSIGYQISTQLPFDAGTLYEVGVALADVSGICADITALKTPANATALALGVVSNAAVAAGTYNVGTGTSGSSAFAGFSKGDANCHSTVSENAVSGTVTFTGVSSGQVSGSFDLSFPDAGHLTGSFSSPTCAAFNTLVTGADAGTVTCSP